MGGAWVGEWGQRAGETRLSLYLQGKKMGLRYRHRRKLLFLVLQPASRPKAGFSPNDPFRLLSDSDAGNKDVDIGSDPTESVTKRQLIRTGSGLGPQPPILF